MQPKSRGGRGLFCWLAPVFLAGCTTPPPEQPRPEHAGARVRVSCPNEQVAALLRTETRTWATRQAASVEVVQYPAARGPAGGPEADLWVLPPAQMPRWAHADQLQTLPAALRTTESYDWMDLLPQFRELLQLWDRKVFAAPIVGEGPVCFYRSDLFADPGLRSAYEAKYSRTLGPPATWEELADQAEFFEGRPHHGLTPLPAEDDELDRAFFSIAACFARRAMPIDELTGPRQIEDIFSFQYDVKTGLPRIDAPGFVHALRLLQRLQSCRAAGVSPNPTDEFRDGKAALCLAEARWTSVFQASPALRDRFGVCPVPAASFWFDYASGTRRLATGGNRVPYLGSAGWLLAVPKAVEAPAAAFDLLAELSGPVASRQIVINPRWGGGPTRRDHLKGAVRWEGFDLSAANTRALKEALDTAVLHPRVKNPTYRLRIPDAAAREIILLTAVRSALLEKADAETALKTAALRWRELDAAKGANALADYRLSVGLLAK